MDYAAVTLLVYAVVVVGSILITGFRHPVRGTGGAAEPPIREKPSADEASSPRTPPA